EPQQHAVAARPIYLLALQRLPHLVSAAPVGVHRHQSTGHEERCLALGFERVETPLCQLVDVEYGGARCRRGFRSDDARQPGRAPRPVRLGGLVAVELLVAGAGPRPVVVARGDDTETEAAGTRGIVEVGDRQRVLRRTSWAVVEGWNE